MRAFINGQYVDMQDELIPAPEPSTEPTAEEIAEAETKVLIAETLIELGVLV